jgi:RNA polymerase sigma-70 factor (ECF subfamily)
MGDELACELVVRRFGARLLAVARRVLGNDDDARDALQDAFLCAFRAIDRFTGDARLSTWLHRIVVNAALMRLRSRRRRAEDSIDDLLPRFDDEGGWLEPPTSWRSDELLERGETRVRVRQAIEQLPARHREVLVLRDIEELDTGEVAGMLGISANAVKVRLHRARQALRTLIERDLVADETRPAAVQPLGRRE